MRTQGQEGEKADRVIESESTLVLTRRESVRLLDLIENPPPRNELFLKAQAKYRKTFGVGPDGSALP